VLCNCILHTFGLIFFYVANIQDLKGASHRLAPADKLYCN
jgi:hypothetical protein